jgi:predicted transcriptional regulator
MTMGKQETQYQMSNEFASYILKYLKENKIKFKDFCEKLNLPVYMTRKIIDRKFKMHIYYSYLLKIAKFFGCENNFKLASQQSTRTD